MFKRKDKGIAPVVVVAILMLCAMVVSYITYRVSLNVSGYSVQGTYDAYETLTGDKIPPKNNPAHIWGGMGNIGSGSQGPTSIGSGGWIGNITGGQGGNKTEKPTQPGTPGTPEQPEAPEQPEIPEREPDKIYKVYTAFHGPLAKDGEILSDDEFGTFSYTFQNGQSRLCTTYTGNYDDMTYLEFMKDDKSHPSFDYVEPGILSPGGLYLESRERAEIKEQMRGVATQYYPEYDEYDIEQFPFKFSDTITWEYDDKNDEYFVDLAFLISSINMEYNEEMYLLNVDINNINNNTSTYYQFNLFKTWDDNTNYTLETLQKEAGINIGLSDDCKTITLPDGTTHKIRYVRLEESQEGEFYGGTPAEMTDVEFDWRWVSFYNSYYNVLTIEIGELVTEPSDGEYFSVKLHHPYGWRYFDLNGPEYKNYTYLDFMKYLNDIDFEYLQYSEAEDMFYCDGCKYGSMRGLWASGEYFAGNLLNTPMKWKNQGEGCYYAEVEIDFAPPAPTANDLFRISYYFFDDFDNIDDAREEWIRWNDDEKVMSSAFVGRTLMDIASDDSYYESWTYDYMQGTYVPVYEAPIVNGEYHTGRGNGSLQGKVEGFYIYKNGILTEIPFDTPVITGDYSHWEYTPTSSGYAYYTLHVYVKYGVPDGYFKVYTYNWGSPRRSHVLREELTEGFDTWAEWLEWARKDNDISMMGGDFAIGNSEDGIVDADRPIDFDKDGRIYSIWGGVPE